MAHIDYITASIPYSVFDVEQLPVTEAFNLVKQEYPPKRYETAWTLANGALIAIPAKKNARQKVLFQMAGDSLQANRSFFDVQDTKLLHWLMVEQKAKFSRLDIAFDTSDPSSWPGRLLWEWRWKQVRTRIKAEPRRWHEEGGGETIYFGAKESERQLRVYDKAEELKLLAGIITRVEIQTRDDMSQHLVGQILKNNELNWTCASAVKNLIDFPFVRWFQELMESGGVELEPLGRKQTDWMKWWRNDVESSGVNHYRSNERGERMFLRQSYQRMMDKFDQIDQQERVKRS